MMVLGEAPDREPWLPLTDFLLPGNKPDAARQLLQQGFGLF
jgi:hypothetical protein